MSTGARSAAVAWPPVRRHLRAVRRSHATRSPRALLAQGYEWALYAFVVGGLVVTGLRTSVASLAVPPAGAGAWLGATALLAATGAVASLLAALGPVVVAPAPASWLLVTPLDRGGLLAGRAAGVAAGTAAVAGGVVGLVAAGAGAASPVADGVAGAAGALLVAALCVRAQAVGPRADRVLTTASRTVLVVALLAAAGLVLVDRSGAVLPAPVLPAPWPAAAVLGVVALGACAAARRVLGRAGTPALTRGTPLVAAVVGGATAADPSVATGALAERRLLRRGTVRSGRHRPGRRRALLRASLRSALRNRPALGAGVVVVVLTHVTGLLVAPLLLPAVQLAATTVAAAGAASSLRTVAGSPSLRRDLGGGDRELVALHAVVPFAAAVLCAVLVAPAGGTVASLVLAPVSAVAVVLRYATRPPRAPTATLYESPIGVAVPVEVVQDLSRGPALFVVLAAVATVVGA